MCFSSMGMVPNHILDGYMRFDGQNVSQNYIKMIKQITKLLQKLILGSSGRLRPAPGGSGRLWPAATGSAGDFTRIPGVRREGGKGGGIPRKNHLNAGPPEGRRICGSNGMLNARSTLCRPMAPRLQTELHGPLRVRKCH